MAFAPYEKAYISGKNIDTIIQKAIMKDKGKNTRILYAGANPYVPGTMVVCKVVELFRGKFFYEETVFNPTLKSVHTTLSKTTEKFDEIIKASDRLYQMKYRPDSNFNAATLYSRQLSDGRVFHDTSIIDSSTKGYLSPLFDFYYNWKIRSYLNKKK